MENDLLPARKQVVNKTEKQRGGAPLGSHNHESHGLHSMKSAMVRLGSRAIDGRSEVGVALRKWRKDLIADLGGNVSTQQDAIIDLAIKSKLLLDSIDAWLLSQPSIILKRKKTLMPVVMQRQQLADGFARYMAMLGLERVEKSLSLNQYLQQQSGDQEDNNEAANQNDQLGEALRPEGAKAQHGQAAASHHAEDRQG
jgi:hypothetical protein